MSSQSPDSLLTGDTAGGLWSPTDTSLLLWKDSFTAEQRNLSVVSLLLWISSGTRVQIRQGSECVCVCVCMLPPHATVLYCDFQDVQNHTHVLLDNGFNLHFTSKKRNTSIKGGVGTMRTPHFLNNDFYNGTYD